MGCIHVQLCFCSGRREERGSFPLQVRKTEKNKLGLSEVRRSGSACVRVCVCLQEHDLPDKRQSQLHRLQLFTGIKLSLKYPLRGFDLNVEGK